MNVYTQYKSDPIGFAHECLRMNTSAQQNALLSAIFAGQPVVAMVGHKTGTTTALAIAALCWATARASRVVCLGNRNGLVERETDKAISQLAGPDAGNLGLRRIVYGRSIEQVVGLGKDVINDGAQS